MRTLLLTIFLVTIFPAAALRAQEDMFQDTADEIVKKLTRPAVKTRGFVPNSKIKSRDIKVVEKDEHQIVEKTIIVTKNDTSPRVNMKIEFDYNSYLIRRSSFTLLNELAKAITDKKLSDKTIIIKGHTDSDGSDAYNLILSLNRALSVLNYILANFPVEASRLRSVGYGEALPLVPNNSAASKQVNRRVEIQLEK
ncbi:hypothetical protein BuS5_01486 [Desulfosarcina sp. BuS5]|uniref:OmpA family protein n=1 Tax=Desulfosarcina sp. BuS5 TaxID=933262 RepID=UPI0004851B03|nr:OmpA family protein [Desulfosarcina sp. BuS5]WDN88518.1 hypothetical protein BuS5_01486 [Desulfosarcina sp. BuS5]